MIELPVDTIQPTIPHDPKDDPILATAIVGQASVLCTLDRHFRQADVRAFCEAHSLRVLSDVELLAELRAEAPQSEETHGREEA